MRDVNFVKKKIGIQSIVTNKTNVNPSAIYNVQFIFESNVGDFLPAVAVNFVGESGVVHVQFRFVFGHQVVAVVQVTGVSREPRVLDVDVVFG